MSNQTGRYTGRPTGGRPPGVNWENGYIPLSELGRVETQKDAEYPYLYKPAAIALDEMTKAARRDGVIIQAIALYRDYAGQVRMKKYWTAKGKPNNAAEPGTSSHGWGTAGDFNQYLDGVLAWLKARAGEFGWDHPRWAGDGVGTEEPWHWQAVQGFTLPAKVPVLLNGVQIPNADAYRSSKAGKPVYVALRPFCDAVMAQITRLEAGRAEVDGVKSEPAWVPRVLKEGRSFTPVRELCEALKLGIQWTGKEVHVSL